MKKNAKKDNFRPENPIGIFDSGIGGLTVAKALCERMPHENIIYFGDTAHMPYGEKSPHAIKSYAEKITAFLLEQKCKLIVIACNSASVTAFKNVEKMMPRQKFVINVIDPVVNYMVDETQFTQIGLIGTKRTVSSQVYHKKFKKKNSEITLKSLATPLLAPMIEEGFFNNNISRTVVNSYLSNPHIANVEAIILACTHYPLIMPEIDAFYKGNTHIVNSADIVSASIEKFLIKHTLQNKSKAKGRQRFYVSDYTDSFEKSARQFFGRNITLKEQNLWQEPLV
ncbi:MAG: glutamate racemase [Bacteroidia bacterium]|nr:glutamate racemase [Bacteroidia bacterium]